jgi:hypothetical protein
MKYSLTLFRWMLLCKLIGFKRTKTIAVSDQTYEQFHFTEDPEPVIPTTSSASNSSDPCYIISITKTSDLPVMAPIHSKL